MPISCPEHNNIKFDSLSSYLIHCKETHKIFTCKDCRKVFDNFKNLKLHIYKMLNIDSGNEKNENIVIKDKDAPPLFKDPIKSNNIENKIKCTECELFFDSVEKMSIHFYEAHEKKFENLIQKEDLNIKNVEVKEKSTLEREEEMEFIKEIIRENPTNKKRQNLQRKKSQSKKEGKNDNFIMQEELIRQEELKRLEELKRQEELKRFEEFKRLEELKKQEELKRLEELKRQEELKRIEEIKNNAFYNKCDHDNKKYSNQKSYIEYFRKEHPNDYPFYCYDCQKGFVNENDLNIHYNSKKHKFPNKTIKCKVCGRLFATSSALENHCRAKNH